LSILGIAAGVVSRKNGGIMVKKRSKNSEKSEGNHGKYHRDVHGT